MKRKRNKLQIHRLKKRDYLFIAVLCVLALLVLLFYRQNTERAKKEQVALIKEVMAQTSGNNKEVFETYIEDKLEIIQALASYPDIYEMDTEKQKAFIKGRSAKWGFSHIFVMNQYGVGYYIEDGIYKVQKGEEFFENIMSHDIYLTEPFYTAEGRVIMTICVSIYDKQGEKVGVLCGAVNLYEIQKMINKNETILSGNTVILDQNGLYITSQKASDVYNKISIFKTPDSELSLIQEAFEAKSDMAGEITLNGVTYLTQLVHLEDFNWMLVQTIPMKRVTDRYANLDETQHVVRCCVALLMICIVRIIIKWRKSDRKTYTDALTKCNSRAACRELLDNLEENHKQDITIVYMDLNRFKWVNDTYGHDKGDEIIVIFSKVLKRTLGKEGFVGRMGGDEFIAVFLDMPEEELQELWATVEKELEEASKELDFDYTIRSAHGYATRQKNSVETLQAIMQIADREMYLQKESMKG